MEKQQKIRLFVILTIPLMLCLLLYPPNEEINFYPSPLNEGILDDVLFNKTQVPTELTVYSRDIFKPTMKNTIGNILQIPLNLRWYDICFKNTGKRFFFPDDSKHNTTIMIELYEGDQVIQIMKIPPEYMICNTYQIGTEFTYQLTTKTTLPLLKLYELEKMKIFNEMNWAEIQYIYSTPEIIADGKPNKYALIAKYTLVFISWFAVIWLLTRIRKLIINGWDC